MPTISFRKLVPKDSKIFRIAESGTVLEFRQALDEGNGSINDYDGSKSVFAVSSLICGVGQC